MRWESEYASAQVLVWTKNPSILGLNGLHTKGHMISFKTMLRTSTDQSLQVVDDGIAKVVPVQPAILDVRGDTVFLKPWFDLGSNGKVSGRHDQDDTAFLANSSA